MCLTFPGRVVAIDGLDATVEVLGCTRHASALLVPDVRIGDAVAVAAGTILRRLDADEAAELLSLLRPAIQPGVDAYARTGGSRVPI
jgi:hydrogenase expression/formation protein HypC